MAQVNCPECDYPVKVGSTECSSCGLIFQKYKESIKNHQNEMQQYYDQEQAKQQLKREQQRLAQEKKKQEQLEKLTKCDACNSTISQLATACPTCGHPKFSESRTNEESAGSIESSLIGLFDFQFKTFITPLLVKILYVLNVILLIGAIGVIIILNFSSFGSNIGYTIGIIIGYVIFLLVTRVFCEVAMMLFKIEENTRK